MSERIVVPGLSEAEQDTLDGLVTHLDAKSERNLLRASYYDGKRALRQVGTVIPPQYYRLGLVLGWSAKAVDMLARRCNLDGFVWDAGTLGDIGFTELWDSNLLDSEFNQAETSGLIHAVSFLVTTKGAEGEPKALIHAKDALSAAGHWNSRQKRLDSLLSINGRDDKGKPNALTLYLPDLTIICAKDTGLWKIEDRQAHPWGVPADPLVYRPRTGRPLGSSRISRTVMSLHDAALRTVIRMEGHADVYSFPEMWMLGADSSIFQDAQGNQLASWQIMLGRIKGIPDDEEAANPRADVKQFPASSPEPHIKQLTQQAQFFSGETSIPLTSLGVSDQSNPTSAESYIASREDLIAEAEGCTDDWSPAMRRTITRALAIQNGLSEIPPEWASIAPKWRNPIHVSRAAAADAGAKQIGAVPGLAETEVGLELLGLDPQQIKRYLTERRRQGGSAALQAISGAVAAGAGQDPAAIKAKADAMGVLIRSGVDPKEAAERVGFSGLGFTGAVPVSLRLPTTEATGLESQ